MVELGRAQPAAPRARRRRPSATTWPACSPSRRPPPGAARAGAADFYAAKGYVEALLAVAGLELVVEPTGDLPYLHPGRAARALVETTPSAGEQPELVDVGWIGELHPLVAREWDLDTPRGHGAGAAAFELDADAARRADRGRARHLRGRHELPGRPSGHRGRRPDRRQRGDDRGDGGAGRRRPARGDRRLRRLRGRAGGGGQAVAGAAARVPRARPDADRRRGRPSGATRSSRRWRRSEGRSVAEHRVAVVGAAGFGGAVAASILDRHPSLELTALTARSDAGKRLRDVYPRHRVDLTMDEFDADRIADAADAAIVGYPHKAAAPVVRELRERGLKVVDLSADFRLSQELYEREYQPHEAPELLAEAVYGLPELGHREAIAGADLVGAPGCYPTASLLGAVAAAAIWRATRSSTPSPACPARAATPTRRRRTSCRSTRTSTPYKVEGHRHRAELDQELPDGLPGHLHAAPAADRPGPDGELLRDADGELTRRRGPRAVRGRLRRRAVRRAGRCAARRARRARDQPLPDPRDRRAGDRPGARLRGDRQPLEGRGRPGGPGPEPDARHCPRPQGLLRDATREYDLLPLALGRRARARRPSSSPTGCRAGFRAAGVARRDQAAAGARRRASTRAAGSTPTRPSRRRASATTRSSARRSSVTSEARTRRRCARCSRTPATRTSPTARAGWRRRGRRRPPPPQALGHRRRGWSALASTGVIGRELPRDALLAGVAGVRGRAGRRQRGLLPGDPDHRQGAEAGLPRGRAAVRRHGAARRPGEGRRDDLAALRDDVLLRRDRRRDRARDARPADRRLRQAVVRPDLGRRPAVDLRHRDRVRQRRLGRAGRAGVAGRAGASARRWTRCCASSRSRWSPTARARRASGGSSCAAPPSSSSRSRARSPTRRWSSRRCSAPTRTSAASCSRPARRCGAGAPFVVDLVDRGDPGRLGGRSCSTSTPRRGGRSSGRSNPREVDIDLALPGEGGETEVFFSDLTHEYVTINAKYTHVMRDVETLLEALPYIRDFHGRTVVIKYGGAAMIDDALKEEFARDVVLLKYVGMNPVVVHGGGPATSPLHGAARDEGRVRRRAARLRRRDRRGREDGPGRQAEQGHRRCGSAATASRRSASAATTGGLFTARKQLAGAAGDVDIGFVGEIERVDVDVLRHIAEDYIPVVASVGADAEGNSYNINADDGRAPRSPRRSGRRRSIFLTDVVGWLDDPADEDSLIAQATLERGQASGSATIQRRDAAEARGLRRRARGRRPQRPHRRRPAAALAAARAVHRQGHRHEAVPVSRS